jgi:hypothetical protein
MRQWTGVSLAAWGEGRHEAGVAGTRFVGPRVVRDGHGKATKQVPATFPRPEFPPVMASRKAVNAQDDSAASYAPHAGPP